MSTAAELSVNILANTSQFGPQMDNVRKKLHEGLESPPSLKELAHDLHGAQRGLAEFNSLFEIGLGMHVSRMFFEKIHEGLTKLGEKFKESREYGLSWGESLLAAGGKVLGLKTRLDELIEAEKKDAKAAKEAAEEHQRAAEAMHKLRDIQENFDDFGEKGGRDRSLRTIDNAVRDNAEKIAEARRKANEAASQQAKPHSDKERDKLTEEYNQQINLAHQLVLERRKLLAEQDREEIIAMRRRVDQEANLKDKKEREKREKDREESIREGMRINEADARMHEEIRKELAQKQENDDKKRLEQLRGQLTKIHKEAHEDTGRGGAISGRAVQRGSVEEAKALDEARQAMGGNKQVELQAETNKILNEVKTILQKDKGQGVQDMGNQILAGVASIT